jgi:hypothetical protein
MINHWTDKFKFDKNSIDTNDLKKLVNNLYELTYRAMDLSEELDEMAGKLWVLKSKLEPQKELNEKRNY